MKEFMLQFRSGQEYLIAEKKFWFVDGNGKKHFLSPLQLSRKKEISMISYAGIDYPFYIEENSKNLVLIRIDEPYPSL